MNRSFSIPALCAVLACASPAAAQPGVGAWFLNARGTGDPPAHFVVGGSTTAPPISDADARFGWSWSEGIRAVEAYPEAPGFALRSVLRRHDGTARTWSFPAGDSFPRVGIGPGRELWLLSDSAAAGRAERWAELLDAVEAAYRQRAGADTVLGVVRLGTLGNCTISSAPAPEPRNGGWPLLELAGAARDGRPPPLDGSTDSLFLAPATPPRRTSDVRARRFLRWVQSPERGGCGATALALFPVPGAGGLHFLNVHDTQVDIVPFGRLEPGPWLSGVRTLVADITLAPVQGLAALEELSPGNSLDLCTIEAVQLLCRIDEERRRALYTAHDAGGAEPLKGLISAACARLMSSATSGVDATEAACGTPALWGGSEGGVYRTAYAGPWQLSATPLLIVSRLSPGGGVQWMVTRPDVDFPSEIALVLPGGGRATLREGGGSTNLWLWGGALLFLVSAAVIVWLVLLLRESPLTPHPDRLDEYVLRRLPVLERRVRAAVRALEVLSREPLHLALLGHRAHARPAAGSTSARPKLGTLQELARTVAHVERTENLKGVEGMHSFEGVEAAEGEAPGPLTYLLAGWHLADDGQIEQMQSVDRAIAKLAKAPVGGGQRGAAARWWSRWRTDSRIRRVLALADDPVALVVAGAHWARYTGLAPEQSPPTQGPWSGLENTRRRLRQDPSLAVLLGWRPETAASIPNANVLKPQLAAVLNRNPGAKGSKPLAESSWGWLLVGRWLREEGVAATPSERLIDLLDKQYQRYMQEENRSFDPVMVGVPAGLLAWLLLGSRLASEDGTHASDPQQESHDTPSAEEASAPPPEAPHPAPAPSAVAETAVAGSTGLSEAIEADRAQLSKLTEEVRRHLEKVNAAADALQNVIEQLVPIARLAEEAVKLSVEMAQQVKTEREDIREMAAREAKEQVGQEVANWRETALAEVRNHADNVLNKAWEPVLRTHVRLRPLLESDNALQRVRRLLSAAETHENVLDHVLVLTDRLPEESLLAFLDPASPFVHADFRRTSEETAREAYRRTVANVGARPEQERAALLKTVRAGIELGTWINILWEAFAELAGNPRFEEKLVSELQPPAQGEWKDAYTAARAFASFDAVLFRRLYHVLEDERELPGILLGRGFDADFLSRSGLADGGSGTRHQLRSFLVPRKQAGPLDQVILALQYLVEAYPREHLRRHDPERETRFHEFLRKGITHHELAPSFHALVERFAAGVGFRYHAVPYYDSRIDQEPHRSAIRQSVGALSLTGRVGYEAYTDPQKVVRLERPFFFEDDTFHSGYAYVARDHT